jgi:hypothetical protein
MDHHCHVDVVEMALGDELGLAEQEFDFSTLLSGVQRAFSRHWRSLELGEQHLCRFEIGRIEAFSEPAVDRCEKVAGIVATVLVAGFAVAGRRSMPVSFALSGAEWRATADRGGTGDGDGRQGRAETRGVRGDRSPWQ